MKFSALLLSALASHVSARVSRSNELARRIFIEDNPDENLAKVGQGSSRYEANITIDGFQYAVMIDTGSTDLWVYLTNDHKNSVNKTGAQAAVQYGSSKTSGDIAVGKVALGKYEVPAQAFIIAENQDPNDSDIKAGLQGLIGLAFDNSSNIDQAIKNKYGSDARWGQSFASNVFDLDTSKPHQMGISLSRSNDSEGTANSSLYFGELDPDYASVANNPKIPLFPANSTSWYVLIDSISVDGQSIGELKTTYNLSGSAVPDGKLVAALDTGGVNLILPQKVLSALFAKVPGTVEYAGKQNNASTMQWYLPCDANNVVQFTIGGQNYPMNPLDLSTPTEGTFRNGTKYITCIADAQAIESYSVYVGTVDGLLGPPFLRNVYSLHDFGTENDDGSPKGDAFVQLMADTDGATAAGRVSALRAVSAPTQYRVTPAQAVELAKQADGLSSSGSVRSVVEIGKVLVWVAGGLGILM